MKAFLLASTLLVSILGSGSAHAALQQVPSDRVPAYIIAVNQALKATNLACLDTEVASGPYLLRAYPILFNPFINEADSAFVDNSGDQPAIRLIRNYAGSSQRRDVVTVTTNPEHSVITRLTIEEQSQTRINTNPSIIDPVISVSFVATRTINCQ